MRWDELLTGVLSSSPTALVMGFALVKLWNKLESKDKALEAANDARIKDLIEVAKRDD